MKPTGLWSILSALLLAWPNFASAVEHFVDVNGTNPAHPYTNWDTAALSIQDAVDAASAGDEIVVTNGVYRTGGRAVYGSLTNRVAATKPVVIRSVNGPAVTIIQGNQIPGDLNGDGAVRCVYLTNYAALMGFTLTGGATRSWEGTQAEWYGGGACCEKGRIPVISNCWMIGNSAYGGGGGVAFASLIGCLVISNYASTGGGAYSCRATNCLFSSNTAQANGGGISGGSLGNCILCQNSADFGGGASSLYYCQGVLVVSNRASHVGGGLYQCSDQAFNCTVVFNSAHQGGGAFATSLRNSICLYNSATIGTNWNYGGLNYCCTVPLPGYGVCNFTNEPLFVDPVNGNFRLRPDSLCINGGSNSGVTIGADLDGPPRIVGGTVDIGAYEFRTPQSRISYAWLQQYKFPTDGSADYLDPDQDGMNNWQEWRCRTGPTDPLSVLKVLRCSVNTNGFTLTWQSVTNVWYYLQGSTNVAKPEFWTWPPRIVGEQGTTTFTYSYSTGNIPFFYRVGVE